MLQPTEVLPPEPPRPDPVPIDLPPFEIVGGETLDYLESATVVISAAQRARADAIASKMREDRRAAERPAAPRTERPEARVVERPTAEPRDWPAAERRDAPAHAAPDEATATKVRPDGFVPANATEESLLAAAEEGNTDSFLSTLLLAKVLLPGGADAAELLATPGAWRIEQIDGSSYAIVFTSKERLAVHAGATAEAAWVRFTQLIREWPSPGLAFAVNPGTPVGATLPGEQIVALAAWADEVGLNAEEEPEEVAAPEPDDREYTSFTAPQAERSVVMQKAISADQLNYYLQRGYDRVSGFAHRAAELAHLRTPGEIYAALGLSYSGSPFKPDDEDIYLLRWTAYRNNLYRIPYGGQHEAAMRAMQGWVIERAPFRGNGFAPSEGRDVVAEFKVDSVRLPHGSQLWHLDGEGHELLIAVLDADGPRWRQVGEP